MNIFYPRCLECGGLVRLTKGSGRFREVQKGVYVAIPEDFEIPTCELCGDECWSVEMSQAIDNLTKE
jgi:hypothetical protein